MATRELRLLPDDEDGEEVQFVHDFPQSPKRSNGKVDGPLLGSEDTTSTTATHPEQTEVEQETKSGCYATVVGHCEKLPRMAKDKIEDVQLDLKDARRSCWKACGSMVQWGVPTVLVIFAALVHMLASRVATIRYVRYIELLKGLRIGRELQKQLDSSVGDRLVDERWMDSYHQDYPQLLFDVAFSYMDEPLQVQAWVWDAIMAPVPLVCFGLMVGWRDAYMYTKTSACFVLLILGRSACMVATQVPDANGWEACKARITYNGAQPGAVSEMRNANLTSFQGLVHAELQGTRYCGDMVYSGLTIVTMLSALALCETLGRIGYQTTKWLVGTCLVPIVLLSSLASLAAHRHYTVDVVLAILLTAFCYDSEMIKKVAKWWASIGEADEELDPVFVPEAKAKPGMTGSCINCGLYLVDLALVCKVAWSFYIGEQTQLAYIYFASLGTVSFVLTLYAWTDKTLEDLHVCLRLPACLFLGVTHLVYFVKVWEVYTEKDKGGDGVNIIKVFKAALQAAPLACVQLYLLDDGHYQDNSLFRTAQMCMSLVSIGRMVADSDCRKSTVLSNFAHRPLWQLLLAMFRVAEASSRIALMVLIQSLTVKSSIWIAPGIVALDFLIVVCIHRGSGHTSGMLAALMGASVSTISNVNLFQKLYMARRLADRIGTLRLIEWIIAAGTMMYYVRFGSGADEMLKASSRSKYFVLIFSTSLVVYFTMYCFWMLVRRSKLPREWEDQE